MDNAGRTSLRQIVKTEGEGRTSLIGLSNANASSLSKLTTGFNSGDKLKLVRKSELSQEFLTSKSVISIKGENQVEYKYGSAQQVVEAIAEQMKFSLTAPAKEAPIFDPTDLQDGIF